VLTSAGGCVAALQEGLENSDVFMALNLLLRAAHLVMCVANFELANYKRAMSCLKELLYDFSRVSKIAMCAATRPHPSRFSMRPRKSSSVYSSKFVSGHAPYLGILRLKNRPTTCDLGYRVYRGPRVRHCRHFLNCPSVANSPSQRASALVESLVHGSSKDVPPPLQSAGLIGLLDDPVDL
jgi:hypothetical protein